MTRQCAKGCRWVKGPGAVKQKKEKKGSASMSIYLCRCGQCGANKNSENFKARPAGRLFDVEKWLLEDEGGRRLRFFALDRFAENMPQQNNGRDCGIFAMEVARSRVRAALAAERDKARAESDTKI